RGCLFVCLGLTLGCSEELGPIPLRVTRVRGVARQGLQPLSKGWIEFIPVEGTVGNLRSARLRSDGSFETDKVAVGKNLIRFVTAPIESKAMAGLFGSFASPIRRVIPEQPGEPLDIDLYQEVIRFQGARSRAAAADTTGPGPAP